MTSMAEFGPKRRNPAMILSRTASVNFKGMRRRTELGRQPKLMADKPVALVRLWIEYLSKPGEVLDAFCSSGACAEAGLGIGRIVVAVEADEAQYKAIDARLLRLVQARG